MPFGIQNPGIARFLARADNDLLEHDRRCKELDDGEWQKDFSLRDHHRRVADVVREVSEERGVSDSDLALRVSIALTHDLGKLHPTCMDYRRNRCLTDEERYRVNRHPLFTQEHVGKFMQSLRQEDHVWGTDLCTVGVHHHEPYKIWRQRLRVSGWDVMLSDAFVSFMEDRDRPGLHRLDALEQLPGVIRTKVPSFWRFVFAHEIRGSLEILNRLYGNR